MKALEPRFKKTLVADADAAHSISENGKRAIVSRIRLSDLAQFLSVESGQFDDRLIWQNVRYFLGVENEVNREIRETLVSGGARDFWFLNSGLTIVCDQIVSVANGCHPVTMVNPQIVNGCQTATVVHSVATSTMVDLADGYVPLRIIETNDATFIKRIASASNTQSRILGRDLRANDDMQMKIASSLAGTSYFYARKRGETAPRDGMTVIDAARAGQLMLSYIQGQPTKSKTNSNDIFGELYEEAFNPAIVTPSLVIAAYECHAAIDVRRREAIAKQSTLTNRAYAEAWIIEGHFHVLFVLGELLRRNTKPLDDVSVALKLIDEAIAVVAGFVDENRGVAHYRLFRLARSREDLLNRLDGLGEPTLSQPAQIPFGF